MGLLGLTLASPARLVAEAYELLEWFHTYSSGLGYWQLGGCSVGAEGDGEGQESSHLSLPRGRPCFGNGGGAFIFSHLPFSWNLGIQFPKKPTQIE